MILSPHQRSAKCLARYDNNVSANFRQFFDADTIFQLAGIWYLTEWYRLGQPSKTQLVECGPGRGTLMDDMLRALSKFPDMYKTIQGVHLVEASPGLRKMQRSLLVPGSTEDDVKHIEDERKVPYQNCKRADGININWYDGIEFLPNDAWSMIMAHEFFDALPIHTFEVLYIHRFIMFMYIC